MDIGILSFNNGETTPKTDCRSDTEKYSSGCIALENMIPTIYGGVERRPGTKFVHVANQSPVAVRLISFIYSSEIAYVVEFGNLYARFYYKGEILTSGGVPVEISTPYTTADLWKLQTKQIADTKWTVYSDYPQSKLTRTSAITFSLDEIPFKKGPFLLRNDLIDPDVTLSAYMKYTGTTTIGSTGTLLCCKADGITPVSAFQPGHVGALYKLTTKRTTVVSENTLDGTDTGIICAAIDVKGTFTFVTHAVWSGTIILERCENGSDWETVRTVVCVDGDNNIALTKTENSDNVQYRATVTAHASGSVRADITVGNTTMDGIVRVTSYTSASLVSVEVIAKLDTTEGVKVTRRWAEGAWSNVQGYPTSVTFFENRCIYGGMATIPVQVYYT
jgi:hypothetical protein